MPELGRVSREQAAALAGVAPFDNDSGTHKGQRHIAGGRGRLRRSLFAAALPAAFRWNKALIALYARLTGRGKPTKLRSSPAPVNSSSTPTLSSSTERPGPKNPPRLNGCYALRLLVKTPSTLPHRRHPRGRESGRGDPGHSRAEAARAPSPRKAEPPEPSAGGRAAPQHDQSSVTITRSPKPAIMTGKLLNSFLRLIS